MGQCALSQEAQMVHIEPCEEWARLTDNIFFDQISMDESLQEVSKNGITLPSKLLKSNSGGNTTIPSSEIAYVSDEDDGVTSVWSKAEEAWTATPSIDVTRDEAANEESQSQAPGLCRIKGLATAESETLTSPPSRSMNPRESRTEGRKTSVSARTAGKVSEALQYITENPGKIEDFYTFRQNIGKGSFGSVKKATVNASGAKRAIKTIKKSDLSNNRALAEEISILKQIDHMYIIKLYETFEDEDNLYIVMAFSPHGNLTTHVKREGHLTQAKTKDAMRNLISAVNYLHRNFIVHRDVKPDNVLVHQTSPLTLRLIDFGLAKKFRPGQTFMSDVVGTPCFIAPEVYRKKYNQACDIWSCGITMYYLLCGYLPFEGKNVDEIKDKILTKAPTFATSEWADVTADTWGFLDLMLKKNPRVRYTAEQTFHHDWLTAKKADAVQLNVETLKRLRTFRKENRLKRSALTVIASMLKMEDIHYGHQVFVSLDADGDGSISLAEMAATLKSKMKDTDVVHMFEEQDVVEDGHDDEHDAVKPFSYTEFIAATFDRKRCITNKICKAAFACYDKDGDGTISMSELSQGLLLGHLSMEEMARTLQDLDQDGDGFVDVREFREMLLS